MFTVYIVDDDRNLCRCLEQLIPWKEYGYYTPIVCHQGEEALEKMKRRPPDLLITDLKMPVMGGAELCESPGAFRDRGGRYFPQCL